VEATSVYIEIDLNLSCFVWIVHVHIKYIYNKWKHFQLSRQVWTFNWEHKMLKHALVEVFKEEENRCNFVTCGSCIGCYIISMV